MRTSVLVACVVLCAASVLALQGPNVCSRNVATRATRTTLRYYMCPVQKIRRSYVDTETYTVNAQHQYCCDGYRQQQDRCEPVCVGGCVNGNCTAPGVCTCDPGHRRVATKGKTRCLPVCTSPCVNGVCSAPDTCSCNPRYWSKPGSPNECVPVCNDGCDNGVCSAPDTCTCKPGYRAKPGSSNACQPVCAKDCVNGVCTAPDTCTCSHDHEKDTTSPGVTHVCKPMCPSGCVNGACAAPGKCVCDEFYVKDTAGRCVPEVFDVEPE